MSSVWGQHSATPRIRGAAQSTAIAASARRAGDALPPAGGPWRSVVSAAYVVVALLYLGWMVSALDTANLWLAVPFAAANVLTITYGILLAVNGWRREVPVRRPLPYGDEPQVAVLVPTCGEPVPMILRTVQSVLEQDWPLEQIVVVVSDDRADPELATAIRSIGSASVEYFVPLPRHAPGRDGAAKAGNLNSALDFVCIFYPDVAFVETRDADDEMGSPSFMREIVGQFEADPQLAFVQTIKEASVSPGDPFNNRETLFYRGQMLSKNAANAVFPCGSGVVWRRTALHDIGDFPTWNLVEDVQSGVEALSRGWRGMYLPIVGAVGQHAPEDLPGTFKQRGTWALDSVRLVVWRRLKGLRFRQRMHFWEVLLCYLNSFTLPVYIACLVVSLVTGRGSLSYSPWACALFMGGIVLMSELWLVVSFYPYNDHRRRQRGYLRSLWRARVMWNGMAPAYMTGAFRAIVGGPNRKPEYTVTRKANDHRFHWRYVVPHAVAVAALIGATVYAIAGRGLGVAALIPQLYWSGLVALLSAAFISRSWFAMPRPFSLGARARLGSAIGNLRVAVQRPATAGATLAVPAALGLLALAGFTLVPRAASANGLSGLHSTDHRLGAAAYSPVIHVAWRPTRAAGAYSISWSHRSSEPDMIRDLAGSAVAISSPPLAPGRWWFNVRTFANGHWSQAVHDGPYVVAGSATETPLIPPTAFAARGASGQAVQARPSVVAVSAIRTPLIPATAYAVRGGAGSLSN